MCNDVVAPFMYLFDLLLHYHFVQKLVEYEHNLKNLQKKWDDPDIFCYTSDMEAMFKLLQSKVPSSFDGETSVILLLEDSVVEVKMPRCAILYYNKFLHCCQCSVPGFGMGVNEGWASWVEIRKRFMDDRLYSLGIKAHAISNEEGHISLRFQLFGEEGMKIKELLDKNEI